MNYYQELTILPNLEISPYFIWSKLYTQLHLALVEQAKATYGEGATHGDIGVSFPEYKCFEKNGKTISMLGSKLRVFAKTETELQQLNLGKWCERLLDHVHIKSIAKVPAVTEYVIAKRFRQEKNLDSKTLNFAKKHGKTFDEVKASRIVHIAKKFGISLQEATKCYEKPRLVERPYVLLSSLEKKHKFSLEIEQIKADQPTEGKFSTYGLSSKSTLPSWAT